MRNKLKVSLDCVVLVTLFYLVGCIEATIGKKEHGLVAFSPCIHNLGTTRILG